MKNEELRREKDIVERTFKFGIRIIKLTTSLPKNPVGYAVANQVVRSGTSIGANIEEAQSAISKKEFIQKMQISLKEARETKYWLMLINESKLLTDKQTGLIVKENSELIAILNTIVKKAKEK